MSDLQWQTSITDVKPNEVRLRGYRIDKLMGEITFAQAIYLALCGDLPTPAVGRLIDAMLVSSVDHGAGPPSALTAHTVASTGAPLNAAVAAGVLAINQFHGGAIFDCMGVLQQIITIAEESGESIPTVASVLIDEYRAQKKRIAGLGHRIHTHDPRTARLFELAAAAEVSGAGVEAVQALADGFAQRGKALPVNVDGAIAAILVDLNMPQELANAFFIMARVPGLVAHVYEEQTRHKPMRRIHPTDHVYDGPSERTLK